MENSVNESLFGRKREASTSVPCRACGRPLTMRRGCTAVTLRCGACGATYPLVEAAALLTDDLEEELAFVPMDRI